MVACSLYSLVELYRSVKSSALESKPLPLLLYKQSLIALFFLTREVHPALLPHLPSQGFAFFSQSHCEIPWTTVSVVQGGSARLTKPPSSKTWMSRLILDVAPRFARGSPKAGSRPASRGLAKSTVHSEAACPVALRLSKDIIFFSSQGTQVLAVWASLQHR